MNRHSLDRGWHLEVPFLCPKKGKCILKDYSETLLPSSHIIGLSQRGILPLRNSEIFRPWSYHRPRTQVGL